MHLVYQNVSRNKLFGQDEFAYIQIKGARPRNWFGAILLFALAILSVHAAGQSCPTWSQSICCLQGGAHVSSTFLAFRERSGTDTQRLLFLGEHGAP